MLEQALTDQKSQASGKLQHAIVIGSGIAGVVAAEVLTNYFEQVTIMERDKLPEIAEWRKGVPQSRHAHIILKRGLDVLEHFFPGLTDELLAKGAETTNMGRDFAFYTAGEWRPRFDSAITSIVCSRPLLEFTVRGRVMDNPKVSVLQEVVVDGLLADDMQSKATGVSYHQHTQSKPGESQELAADLVIDASGRASRASAWLEELGYTAPEQTVINALPAYATRVYKRVPNPEIDWKVMYVQPSVPNQRRGGVILQMEDNRWHVTLVGMAGETPPNDEAAFLEYARSLPDPKIYEFLTTAEPLGPITGYRRAENRLNHYEQLPRYLDNLIVMGDAVYCFNPVYAQGMSVAAMNGLVLDDCLRAQLADAADLTGLSEHFQKELLKTIMPPWQLSTGEDMRWLASMGQEIPTPDPETLLMQKYIGKVIAATAKNPHVLEAFYHVQNMLESPTIFFRPDIVLQVVATLEESTAVVG